MTVESFLSMTGLGELVDQDFFAAQVGLLGGSVLFFILSLVLCIMAFRAAMAARNARGEAEDYFESAQDLAKEMRHLTAQVEQTMSGERAPLEDATAGIAAASVPSAAMVLEDAAEETETVAEAAVESQAEEQEPALKKSASSPRAGDDTLSFVDAEDPFKEGATCELVDDPETTASASDEEKNVSPLSKLLRRRRA